MRGLVTRIANDTTMDVSDIRIVHESKVKNQEDFITRLEQLYKNNVDISRRKNADYASDNDPFANFRACETLGIKAEIGILVRMTDKLSRVSNIIAKDGDTQVKDESILDTLSDLANYAMILRMYIENK